VPRAEAEAAREEARAASLEAERLRRLVGNMVPRAEMETSTPSLVLCFSGPRTFDKARTSGSDDSINLE
jgi:hypothetical protein